MIYPASKHMNAPYYYVIFLPKNELGRVDFKIYYVTKKHKHLMLQQLSSIVEKDIWDAHFIKHLANFIKNLQNAHVKNIISQMCSERIYNSINFYQSLKQKHSDRLFKFKTMDDFKMVYPEEFL